MNFDAKLSVTEGLDNLATRLDPIIAAKLAGHLGGLSWTAILEQLDQIAGRPPIFHATADLQAQLKMITLRLGDLGYPFDDYRRTASTLGSELRIVRNSWAHGDPFTSLDAWRAHDYCVRLLEYFSDGEGLIMANQLRQEALLAYVDEQGIAPIPVPITPDDEDEPGGGGIAEAEEPEVVTPDPEVYVRESSGTTTVVGENRLPFEPWNVVPAGDVSVLDDLPRLAAKQKVRAVAAEIVEAEGPVHIDRLSQLVAASFGLHKLHASRAAKIVRQVKACGLLVDKEKFVWPAGVDPRTWTEFRPNSSQVNRPLLYISPVEIANAMRFLQGRKSDRTETELDADTLRTFGRRRRTRQSVAHLAKAKRLLQFDRDQTA